MWFSETFEKTVITESVQVTFSCWHLGGDGTWSQLRLICLLNHIWQLQSFIFFLVAAVILVYHTHRNEQSQVSISYFLAEKNHQGIQFSYGRIAHAYCECYSEDNSASGIALSKRTAAGTKQFSYNLLCEAKTYLLEIPNGNKCIPSTAPFPEAGQSWRLFFTLKQ